MASQSHGDGLGFAAFSILLMGGVGVAVTIYAVWQVLKAFVAVLSMVPQ